MKHSFSKATAGFKSSAVRHILKLTQGKEIISFAGGLPAPELFPVDEIRDSMMRVLEQGQSALQYGLTAGYLPLREKLCERMAVKGMTVTPEQIVLTTGSQQAIDLVARVMLDPGQTVLVEDPTYLAAIQIFNSYQVNLVTVSGDEEGMDLAELERAVVENKPRLVYLNPNFANPSGKVWSVQRRTGLVEICRAHGVLILEDDPYGDIQFDADLQTPSMYSIDERLSELSLVKSTGAQADVLAGVSVGDAIGVSGSVASSTDSDAGGAIEQDDLVSDRGGGIVVYTSTFSKIAAPALRTGWVFGPGEVMAQLNKAKEAADLHSSSLDQQALYQLLTHHDIDAHIQTICEVYKVRMNTMSDLLVSKNLPGVQWDKPKGGMFIWVTLPEKVDAEALLACAVKEGVAFVPGATFYAIEPQRNKLRLNYTHTNLEDMVVGVERFVKALAQFS